MSENIYVPFFKPSIGIEEKKAVESVMDSGWLTTGKITLAFEQEFASFTGARFALAVNSNTNGMLLAMEACGIKPGCSVITTPYSFVSTAACALHLGADVIFADIEKDSYSIDCDKIEEILKRDCAERKIRAIVPVHVGGNLCDMKRIRALAKEYSTPENKIFVIEDAAHSFPSKTGAGTYAGTFGDAGVFSFYATKTITTGEGGMITVNDENLARRMRVTRLHGMDRTTWDRYTNEKASWEYDIIACGFKCNLPDVLSAIGREQLKKAQSFYEKRRKIAEKYNEAFRECDFLELPPDSEGNAWHLYLLKIVPELLDCSKETFAREMQSEGIGISVHFIPLFHFTFWKNLYSDFSSEHFPNAESQYQKTISIPLWPDMSEQMIEKVISVVKKLGQNHHV